MKQARTKYNSNLTANQHAKYQILRAYGLPATTARRNVNASINRIQNFMIHRHSGKGPENAWKNFSTPKINHNIPSATAKQLYGWYSKDSRKRKVT
jgi:hypothetical protein